MAKQIQNKTHPSTKPKTTSSCFSGCFGSFQEVPDPDMIMNSSEPGSRKRSRWFSWSSTRFRMKKSAGAKTVPVDEKSSDNSHNKIPPSKSKSPPKLKSEPEKLITGKRQAPVSDRKPPSQVPAAATVASDQETPKQTRHGPAENAVLENRKQLDNMESGNDPTCQKRRSFCRKIDAIRTGLSQPGSPDKPKSNRSTMGRSVSHAAASFPAPKRASKPVSSPPTATRKPAGQEDNGIDPVVGMSIIMVTLIILLLWGRLCAILSTSAWFYFVPRLRKSMNSSDLGNKNGSISDYPDFSSEEYKKRVVLEGFLERNHRGTT